MGFRSMSCLDPMENYGLSRHPRKDFISALTPPSLRMDDGLPSQGSAQVKGRFIPLPVTVCLVQCMKAHLSDSVLLVVCACVRVCVYHHHICIHAHTAMHAMRAYMGRVADISHSVHRSHSGIWVMSADGRHQKRLSGGINYSDLVPSWSPDGWMIAVESDRDDKTGQGITQVWVGTVLKCGFVQCRNRSIVIQLTVLNI